MSNLDKICEGMSCKMQVENKNLQIVLLSGRKEKFLFLFKRQFPQQMLIFIKNNRNHIREQSLKYPKGFKKIYHKMESLEFLISEMKQI